MSGLNDFRYRLHVALRLAIYWPFFTQKLHRNAKLVKNTNKLADIKKQRAFNQTLVAYPNTIR